MEKDELTYSIIGCAMKVHNNLGNGFQEVVYQRCLAIELDKLNIKFTRELEQDIFYDDMLVGTRRVDFIVENSLLIEIKARINLEDVHLAQSKNYLTAFDLKKGLLINFGARSLQYKLIFNSKYNQNLEN
jgi:GxxExxY protein